MIKLSSVDISPLEIKYVNDALSSGWVSSGGPYVKRFEENLSAFYGRPAAVCSSGTAALHLALLAAGIGPGDEVIVPDTTYAATAASVVHVGAVPVCVDVDENWLLTADAIRAAATNKTRAVIPVHLYGQRCNMRAIMAAADDLDLIVIEDCAEAFHVKQSGHYACYSMFANKMITTGEGGVVTSDNMFLIKLYRDGGASVRASYYHEVAGLNYRMTNLQAALGCAQLERLDELTVKRNDVIIRYMGRLDGRGSWHFVAKVPDFEKTYKHLKQFGIESRPVFYPLHNMPPFEQPGNFPNAWKARLENIVLPTGPHLKDSDVDRICYEVGATLN